MVSRWLLGLVSLALGCAMQSDGAPVDDGDAGPSKDVAEDLAKEPDGAVPAGDGPEPAELPGCAGGESLCGGVCVDVTASLRHCGRCDNRCAAGQSCVAGVCSAPAPACASPRQTCGGSCIDPQSDGAHCGRCDNPCPAGQTCRAGVCAGAPPGCAAPRTLCGTSCVDVLTDNANCGVCGLTCAAGQTCASGNCMGASCPPPQVQCAAGCVDTNANANHCGSCGVRCAPGQTCRAGVCTTASTCAPPRQMCGALCVDPSSDTLHCGACGVRCLSGQTCAAGRCTSAPSGVTRAGAACTNATATGGADPACGALVCAVTGSSPMCTGPCTNSASALTERSMCGGGNATCLTQGDGAMANSLCAQACTPGASTGCRPGFVCTGWWYTHAGSVPDGPGCFPFCASDAQCPSGRRCNARVGSCGSVGADLTRLADGSPCNPTMTVTVPGEAQPRNVQCRGLCFRVSNTAPTQGICGSFVDLATARACPDDAANVPLLAPPGADNLGLCVFRNCLRNANCAAPLVCRYDEDAAGIPDRSQPPQCQYPTPAQRTGIP